MKKILVFIIPAILIIASVFSFQAFNKYHRAFNGYSGGISEANRPSQKLEKVSDTLAIVLIEGLDNDSFHKSRLYETYADSSFGGKYLLSPVTDKNFLFQELLTGAKPDVGGYLSGFPFGGDNILKVCRDYELKVTVVRNKDSNVFEGLGIVDNDIVEQIDSAKVRRLSEDYSKNKSNLVIFEFNSLGLAKDRKDFIEKLNLISEQFELLKRSLPPQTTFFVSSLNPNNKFSRSHLPKEYFYNSFIIFGNKIIKGDEQLVCKSEDLTSTFSFILGIPQPTGCMGKPLYQVLDLPEDQKITRLNYYIHNYIQSSLYHLSYFEVEEAISEGFYLESLDLIDLSKPANITELNERIDSIRANFEDYRTAEREKENIKYILISIIVMIVSLTFWLIFLPKNWLSYILGAIFLILLFIFNYFVFAHILAFPRLPYFNFSWMLIYILPSVLISAVIVSVLLTLLGGYLLDLPFRKIVAYFEGITATSLFLIVVESCVLVLREGFVLSKVTPPLFSQFIFFKNFSLIFLMPFVFALMVGVSFLICWLSTKREEKIAK